MRASVGARGAAGSTFDVVAREAGVSRGLLHYYFGSKERLLVEVVRRDCDARIAALEDEPGRATTRRRDRRPLVASLEAFVEDEPGTQAVIYEMLSASRHSEEIRAELAELYRRWRAHLAESLRSQGGEGVVRLDADPESVASVMFALGDGHGPAAAVSIPTGTARPRSSWRRDTARRLLGGEPVTDVTDAGRDPV